MWSFVPAALGAALAPLGCGPRPACSPQDAKGCIIDKVRIIQHHADHDGGVSASDVAAKLATAESSLFVTKTTVDIFHETGKLFFRYERFDRLVLERDLERVERYYRARGYYNARVRAARVIRSGESTVTVEIAVDEGKPTLISRIERQPIDPNSPLPSDPPDLVAAIDEAQAALQVGKRLEEGQFEDVKKEIVRAMTDRGYAYAKVVGRATVDLATHDASVMLLVDAGPRCTFGPITIEGLGDLPEKPLRDAMRIKPGQRFSTERLEAARAAMADFGVLSSVSIDILRTPEGQKPMTEVPIRFGVQPAALRSIQVGGGAELGGRVQTHLVTQWEHKNFLGGLRRFAVGARAGVVFYPLQLTNWNQRVRPLPDIRTQAELRQPGFLEARTTGTARLEANFYRPETSDLNGNADVQRLYVNLEARGVFGLDRPFWGSRVRIGATVNAQVVSPVGVWGTPPPVGFDPLFLTYLEGRAALDLRRGKDGKLDPVNPHSGVYAGTTVQVAGIFPESGFDLRIQPEVRFYAPVSRDVTLAFRLASSVLFPTGYGASLLDPAKACADGDDACQRTRTRAVQIMQHRGFFSGGTSTNRGYGYNGVNPHERIASLFVGTNEQPPLVPIGGQWMWNASLGLRFPIYESFGAEVFVDTSDVWNGAFAFRPHLSPGFGLRYLTPIGPARVDLAVRVPCAQTPGTCKEPSEIEGGPPAPLGWPIYVAIAIGEAF